MVDMKNLTVILTLTVCVSCAHKPSDLTEAEVYTIINEIIADDTLYADRICQEFHHIKVDHECVKEFSEDDIDFIARQKELFKNATIQPGRIKWQNYRGEFDYAVIDSLCDEGMIYHISFPLISIDRNKVIIEFRQDANNILGGHGGKNVYEKKNGHWIKTRRFDSWISLLFHKRRTWDSDEIALKEIDVKIFTPC